MDFVKDDMIYADNLGIGSKNKIYTASTRVYQTEKGNFVDWFTLWVWLKLDTLRKVLR